MNKVYRSTLLKAAAFILCAVFMGCGASMIVNNFVTEDGIYVFEDSYENSISARTKLEEAYNSVIPFFFEGEEYRNYLLTRIEKTGMEYYAKKGDMVYSNISNVPQGDLKAVMDWFQESPVAAGYRIYYDKNNWYIAAFSSPAITQSARNYYREFYEEDAPLRADTEDEEYADREYADTQGATERFIKEEMVVCVRMPEAMIAANRTEWEKLRDNAYKTLTAMIILAALSLGLFIYLCWVVGKKKEDEEVHLLLMDRMFPEITVGILIAAGVLGIMAVVLMVASIYNSTEFSRLFTILIPVTATATVLVVSTCALSAVRNMKAHQFLSRSLVVRIVKFIWNLFKRIVKKILSFLKKIVRGVKRLKKDMMTVFGNNFSERKTAVLFTAYLAVIVLISFFTGALIYEGDSIWPFFFLLVAALVALGFWFVIRRLAGFGNLKDGIRAIRNGSIDYKITGCPEGVLEQMAEDINKIGDGLQESLEKEVKAERMKSELITNVSHDLKTPLTSIINYADLLSKEELKPEEANDYAAIILQKGKRLKDLTADLFDISKVQSGNEVLQMEKLDVVLLMNQTLAELNGAIENASFTLITKMPESELFIEADGRKLSRVFENILNNCIKYAMAGTRVYLSIREEAGKISIELKNIASYAMDFDAENITERFVRGDRARSTEGSGLGLAIAKSYTNACGGGFEVFVDGDLFKVLITFREAE